MSARPMSFEPHAPSLPMPLPLAIGKYRVTGLIGEGAMGVVYRAQDPDIQRSVAVKTIRPPLRRDEGDGPTAMRQFRVEAQAAGRLNHANIVAIYECGEYGDSGEELFIAMECVDGPSLSSLARQGDRLALPDVLAVMLQLLEALQCAHAQRVWHCDIKPSNLLVAPDGRIKVTDFGIARVEASGLTMRNALWGSPGYMAPERYAGGAIDQRVDIFSCGVLLYELLTGCAPFMGSASSVMYQVLQQQAPRASMAPGSTATPALDEVVARALAKHPGDRYASAEDMRRALLDAMASVRAPRTLSRDAMASVQRPSTGPQPALPRDLAPTQATTMTAIPLAETLTTALPLLDDPVPAPLLRPASASASASASAPAPRPAPTSPTSPTSPLPAALAELEALLRPCLGPMSRIVVREAAKRSHNLAETAARIADEALTPAERTPFLRAAARLPGMLAEAADPAQVAAQAAAQPGRSATGPQVPQSRTPLRPETVDQAARLLARQAGPIAMLLARRAAADCDSRELFFSRLVEGAGSMVDAEALRAALDALG